MLTDDNFFWQVQTNSKNVYDFNLIRNILKKWLYCRIRKTIVYQTKILRGRDLICIEIYTFKGMVQIIDAQSEMFGM